MKLMKLFSFVMFIIACCTTYAHENKYVFIGQNGEGASAKTAFLLEVSAEDLNDTFVMGANGEIYLKADKVVSIPKQMFMNFPGVAHIDQTNNSVSGRREPTQEWCPVCRMYYTPQPGKGCTNPYCPTNK